MSPDPGHGEKDELIAPRDAETAHPAMIAVVRHDRAPRHTPAHSHARGQLVGTLSGLATVATDSQHWLLPPVNCLWLPPRLRHELRSHGPFHGWSIYVAEPACARLPKAPRIIALSGLLREAVMRAASWPKGPLTPPQDRLGEVILDEIAAPPTEHFCLPMPQDDRLLRIARCLAANPADPRPLPAWAQWIAMTPRSLTRRFPQETGFSFSAWRQRAKLMKALEMLAEGSAVTTVAFALGYETVSSFIDIFKKQFGTTPSRYFASAERAAVIG